MNRKTLVGGLIALAIIVLIALFCVWVGKKVYDGLTGNQEQSETNQPNGQPQNQSVAPASPEQAAQIYLALGNPSNANTSDPNNYLLVNNYYALSYNRARAIPNWAAWRISKAELGDYPRPNPDPFRPDDRIPKGWTRVTPTDYAGSGFDKGHLCPSADRSGSTEGMTATFFMSNMTPQTPDLNRGPWQKFEAYLRTLVTRGSDVYIYAGVYGEDGKVRKKVTIPTNDWKVAIAVPAGSPISSINDGARVIAVDMPNVKAIKNADWQVYRTTVRQIEGRTGLNLFSNLPSDLQSALENKTDTINN